MKTSCGETSEVLAASLHGVVAIIYLVMLAWHGVSVIKHWQRQA